MAKTNMPRDVAICFQEERSYPAPVRWANWGLVAGMVISKEGRTGRKLVLGSPGFGYLLAAFP